VSGGFGFAARVWDAERGQEIAVLKDHFEPVMSAVLSPDGKRVVTASLENTALRIFRHQFDLPKCQVHRGNAAKDLNGHFGDLLVYFLHLAPKTSERTIDDPYDLAFAHLMMLSHTTIRFSYRLRMPVPGKQLRSNLPPSIGILGEAC
jgi:WD40 repeat protein